MVKKFLGILSLTLTCTLLGVVNRLESAEAAACDPTACQPPKCFCPSVNPPGGLPLEKTPQFFLLTFDDSVQEGTLKVANSLIGKRKNPNGCPIRATYYVSIQYTDFSLVTQWYAAGNEVADHTMTHPQDPFDDEIIGCKKSLNAFAGIPNGKIAGWRSPFLNWQPKTFDVIAQQGILYDSSTTALTDDATWPYTMDYGLYNDCWKGFCDTTIHPGLFEIPMAAIIDDKGTPHLMDPHLDGTPDVVKGWLQDNFLRHAKQGKTPFGLFLHPAHLNQLPGVPLAPGATDPAKNLQMLEEFLDWAVAQPDTWFVTSQQLLEWMKNPVPADQLKDFAPFSCQVPKIGKVNSYSAFSILMAMQLPSSSSSFSYRFTYQVFLSFRGSDTRNGFTGHLYKALTNKGIHTFIDDRELQSGDKIKPSLDNAIEESRIFIPVFSINYASSSFCLDELVHIIHCYKTKGRLVLPVFYGVDPTDIRHQSGSYGEHLTKHEKSFQNNKKNMERLHQWKLALTKAANLSGYHFSPGYEYKFIGKIVKYVSNKISRQPLHVAIYPVGLQSRVQQVKSLLDKGSDGGVRMIGLYGIGGMGKSTLAKSIYNCIADQFECSCFLENVRENSSSNQLKHLQEELLLKTLTLNIKLGGVSEGIPYIKERLHTKKILLILDDVDNLEQLHALAGGRDWFGCGSRVIITTRNKHLLSNHEIEIMHEVEGMSTENALELLRWMAFKSYKVPSSYEEILNRAVVYASGLPLAIEVVGSNFFGKSISECESTLDKYQRIPNEDIQKILKVSFDALDEEQQSVFLDIACFFKGCTLAKVEEILKLHYGYCIKSHIGGLVDKSLIKISECYTLNEVTLHDLLEVMGKEIVRKESPKEPEKRSRLWCRGDIIQILQENKGTSKIEMIYLNSPSMDLVIDWNGKAFKKMTNLKTLIIKNVSFTKDPKYLPSSLRVLKLNGCSSESLSSIICSKRFEDMKVLTLDDCQYLTHIPNVSGLPNLEKFSLQICFNLIAIHDSIGKLNKLEILNAYGCTKLESFPPLWLPSLKELDLSFCMRLKSFPELLCKMTNTKEIGMCITSTIEALKLNTNYLPYECLQIVLKSCVNVKFLNLSYGDFKILPECLSECHLMRTLLLNYNRNLEEIRGFPPNLKHLEAFECISLSSSSRRMLLSQQLHEAGCTSFYFLNGTEGIRIPDWFEHQSRGQSISFWFCKKIPSITSIIILPDAQYFLGFSLFVNDYECTSPDFEFKCGSSWGNTYLFDMNLEENIEHCKIFYGINFESEMDKALLRNEWIYVEFKILLFPNLFNCYPKDMIKRSNAEMGIHVLKEKNNTNEDVIFTNPYSRKRKLDEYLNASLSQFHPTLKKHRFVEVGVSETEILQQQHLALVSGMRNLVLTETIEKEHHG